MPPGELFLLGPTTALKAPLEYLGVRGKRMDEEERKDLMCFTPDQIISAPHSCWDLYNPTLLLKEIEKDEILTHSSLYRRVKTVSFGDIF